MRNIKIQQVKVKEIKAKNFKGLEEWVYTGNNLERFNIFKGKNNSFKTTKLEIFSYLLGIKKNLNNKTLKNELNILKDSGYVETTLLIDGIECSFRVEMYLNAPNRYFYNGVEKTFNDYKNLLELIFLPYEFFLALHNPDVFINMNASDKRELVYGIGKEFLNVLNFEKLDKAFLDYGGDLLEEFFKIKKSCRNENWPKLAKFLKEIRVFLVKSYKLTKQEIDNNTLLYTSFKKHLENELLEQVKGEEKSALFFKNESEELMRLINVNNEKLINIGKIINALNQTELEAFKLVNNEVKKYNFNFELDFVENKNWKIGDGGFDILLKYKGIEFDSLNEAQRVLIGTEIILFLQLLTGYSSFIMLDGAERLDALSFEEFKSLINKNNNQAFMALVNNDFN